MKIVKLTPADFKNYKPFDKDYPSFLGHRKKNSKQQNKQK